MFIVVYANSEEKRHQKKAEFAIRLTPEMQCVAHPQEIILLFIISAGHPAAGSAGIRMRRCARNAAFFSLFCAPKKIRRHSSRNASGAWPVPGQADRARQAPRRRNDTCRRVLQCELP